MRNRRRFLFSSIFILVAFSGLVVSMSGCRPSTPEVPPILFLRPDEAGRAQLYLLLNENSSPQPLTDAGRGPELDVIDYAVSPAGDAIAYSAFIDGGATVLRRMSANGRNDRVILECPANECSSVVWAPDGRRLVYERRALGEDGRAGQPRLYWLDLETSQTQPLIEDDNTPNYGATFSPDGLWLSYVSPANEGIVLYQLTDGRQRLLPSRVGRPAAWSPDSAHVVIGDLVVSGSILSPGGEEAPETAQESASVYLYKVGLAEAGLRERLSPEMNIEDSVPAWSPDGQWIAFGRRPAQTVTGRQLWLMRPDGSEARALTNETTIFHGPPSWSPDGQLLLFQRYGLTSPNEVPEIWLLDITSAQTVFIAPDAYQPAWLFNSEQKFLSDK